MIKVPTATSVWEVTANFDQNINSILVRDGKDEKCNGKVCTFTHKREKPLDEGQILELVHRMGFDTEPPQLIGLEFNGEKICGIGTITSYAGNTISYYY